MKQKILGLFLLACIAGGMVGCSEESLERFQTDSYIYFNKSSNDSTTFSFAYDPSLKEGEVRLKLNIISRLADYDRTFSVRVVEEESTAREGRDFTFQPEELIVKANDSIAYLDVHVRKDPSLEGRTVKAIFEVMPSDDFLPGIGKNRKAKLVITDKLTQPDWWDAWHVSSGLGVYSDKKYELFIQVTGQSDLTLVDDGGTMDYSDMRGYVVMFKYWLMENPQKEEDGQTDMVVPVVG